MNARLLSMSEDPIERPHAVLPPPPSTPDDGPSALEVPPLGLPPRSLELMQGRSEPRKYSFPLRTWAALVGLFVVGTIVTYLLER
jgi:hypothetical protein